MPKPNLKMYFKILISSIYTAKNNGPISDIWKFASNFYFATATSVYLLLLFLVINNHLLPNTFNFLLLKMPNGESYNSLLNIAVYFILPIMLLNYYLVYRNERYKTLMENYRDYNNKKTFFIYFMGAFLVILLILFFKI